MIPVQVGQKARDRCCGRPGRSGFARDGRQARAAAPADNLTKTGSRLRFFDTQTGVVVALGEGITDAEHMKLEHGNPRDETSRRGQSPRRHRR